MKLTPERSEIRKAQELKWYDGSRGHCRSYPYQVKRYLSLELSEQIRAEVKAKCDEWIAKLDSIKPSKRIDRKLDCWCDELKPQWCCVDSYEGNAIPTQVLGHKIYIKILDSYRKKNGQLGIKAMAKPKLEVSRYVNSPRTSDWHDIGGLLKFELCWDEAKQLFYVNEYHRAENKPLEICRGNWARVAKRKEFMSEVVKLEDSLTKMGVTILRMSQPPVYKLGLESTLVECEGPAIMA